MHSRKHAENPVRDRRKRRGEAKGGKRRERRDRRDRTKRDGVDEEKGGWTPIERLKTRQAYDRLIRTRMKLKNYKPKKSTQDSAGDTETNDSERTRLLVVTDTQSDTDEE